MLVLAVKLPKQSSLEKHSHLLTRHFPNSASVYWRWFKSDYQMLCSLGQFLTDESHIWRSSSTYEVETSSTFTYCEQNCKRSEDLKYQKGSIRIEIERRENAWSPSFRPSKPHPAFTQQIFQNFKLVAHENSRTSRSRFQLAQTNGYDSGSWRLRKNSFARLVQRRGSNLLYLNSWMDCIWQTTQPSVI